MALSDHLTVTLTGSPDKDHGHYLTVNLNKISASFPDAMAAGKSSTPSKSFFKILKDGALLPARNRSLFAAVFALFLAYTSLGLLVTNLGDLAVHPRIDEVTRDVMAFTSVVTDETDEIDQLLQNLGKDTWSLMRAGAAHFLLSVTVGNAVWIVALFAAVATYAGETCSFGAVLGKVRAQLKGTAVTLAFVTGLKVAYVVLLLSAVAALLVFDFVKGPTNLSLLGWVLLLLAAVFLQYFDFVCELSVVVAVAEPGRHSASAVGRAWRLLRGRKWRAVLFIAVAKVLLPLACSRAYGRLATTRAASSHASGLLLVLLYSVVMDAVELFAVCAITAFYYECKESNDDDAATTAEFVKLATDEPIGA